MLDIIYIVCGFLLLPCVSLICRILNLDDEDTTICFFWSLPVTCYFLVVGFLGVINYV